MDKEQFIAILDEVEYEILDGAGMPPDYKRDFTRIEESKMLGVVRRIRQLMEKRY